MKATSSDRFGNVEIHFNNQAEAILSPDGTQKLLPCDDCLSLEWRKLNCVSFLCQSCYGKFLDENQSLNA